MGEEGSIYERVICIVYEQIGGELRKSQITRETRFKEDLGFDSLDVVEMTMELEEEFDIDIPRDADEQLLTVGVLIDYITNCLPAKEL